MNQNRVKEYRRLKNGGVDLRKDNSVRFNAGGASETIPHIVCKTLAAKVLLTNGYRVDSEVSVGNGDVDILGWGHPERLSYAVEIETAPQPEVIEQKVDRYVKQTPIDDIVIISPGTVPMDMVAAADHIADKLGLSI